MKQRRFHIGPAIAYVAISLGVASAGFIRADDFGLLLLCIAVALVAVPLFVASVVFVTVFAAWSFTRIAFKSYRDISRSHVGEE